MGADLDEVPGTDIARLPLRLFNFPSVTAPEGQWAQRPSRSDKVRVLPEAWFVEKKRRSACAYMAESKPFTRLMT
jgi:hypothetical protein